MSTLTFITGDFSSGTTLLYTLFRQTDDVHALYEPLHQKLLNYLIWPPRAYEGHAFIGRYYDEYDGFSKIATLFDPNWGDSGLHLTADAHAESLYRYLSYLIGTSYAHQPHVVLKENRFAFRLPWLRRHFPDARVVHVYRDVDDQWRSWVRRAQEHVGKEDVGQDRVDFMAFRMAAMCDDLAPVYPELAAHRSSSGFERFSKLWSVSKREQEEHADVSLSLAEIKNEFAASCKQISDTVGYELDAARLEAFLAGERVVRPPQHGLRQRAARLADRAGQRYAEARVARMMKQRSPR